MICQNRVVPFFFFFSFFLMWERKQLWLSCSGVKGSAEIVQVCIAQVNVLQSRRLFLEI